MISQWLTQHLPVGDGFRRRRAAYLASTSLAGLPPQFGQFMAATRVGSPVQAALMGNLAQEGVTPQQFADINEALIRGVAYDYYRYGTAPSGFGIDDHAEGTLRYSSETNQVTVTRNWYKWLAKDAVVQQSKTDPYVLSNRQMATMYGVEEGFHCTEFTKWPEIYEPLSEHTLPPSAFKGHAADYDKQKIEGDAKIVVQEALKDFHYDIMPKQDAMRATLERHWQDRVARERAASPAMAARSA